MFRLNFWSHQPLSGPVTGPAAPPAGLIGIPGSMSVLPFYSGLTSMNTTHPPFTTQSLLSNGLLHNSSRDAINEYNAAAAATSFWRHGLASSDHVTSRTPSPDAQKRSSPGDLDRALRSGTMTSYPAGTGSFDNHAGSQAFELHRQSLYLRSQLVALRQYQQQQQLEAKYQLTVTCSGSDSPIPQQTGSNTTTGSDVTEHERATFDRKRSRLATDGDDKLIGLSKSRDDTAGTTSLVTRRRNVASRNRVTSSPEIASERGLYYSCIEVYAGYKHNVF